MSFKVWENSLILTRCLLYSILKELAEETVIVARPRVKRNVSQQPFLLKCFTCVKMMKNLKMKENKKDLRRTASDEPSKPGASNSLLLLCKSDTLEKCVTLYFWDRLPLRKTPKLRSFSALQTFSLGAVNFRLFIKQHWSTVPACCDPHFNYKNSL